MSELVPGTTLASGAGTGLGMCVSLWNDKSLFRKSEYGLKMKNFTICSNNENLVKICSY